MLGITIRKTSTKNDLTTKEGKVFDLSDAKVTEQVSALVIKYLKSNGFFSRG